MNRRLMYGYIIFIVASVSACGATTPIPLATETQTSEQASLLVASTPSSDVSIATTLIPSVVPFATAVTPYPEERLIFAVATDTSGMSPDTVITFANNDGTRFETPSLFEHFRWIGSGKYLVWSPNARYLAFDGADKIISCGIPNTDCTTTNYGTFLVDYSQGVIARHIEGTLTNSSWSPDSQSLVLSIDEKQSSDSKSLVGDLFILNVKTGQKTQLTNDSSNDLYPSWSPDGRWIAFLRYIPESLTPQLGYGKRCNQILDITLGCNFADLYITRNDGSNPVLLLKSIYIRMDRDGRDGSYNSPAWSPDSRWLAVLTGSEQPDITLVNTETGETRVLAANPALDIYPAWSPDGNKLAFVSNREGNEEIYLISPDGTNLVNLTNNAGSDFNPVWSPSGRYIAFLSNRGEPQAYRYGLYVMNFDGTNQHEVDSGYVFTKPAWFP